MTDFDRSNCNISLNGTVHTATCKRADGVTNTQSSLDLNSLIANDNGQLVLHQGRSFRASCTDIKLITSTILTCTAIKIDAAKNKIQINLSNFMANIDGQLRTSQSLTMPLNCDYELELDL